MGKVKLQLLTTTEDTKDNVVSFTSGDTANPSTWKDVAALVSNENHKSILNKISTMFNNVRYLYKILGSTDISALGSVTQAIATLNGNVGSMKGISSSAAITTQGQYALDAREKNASVDGTLANEINKLNSNLIHTFLQRSQSIELITSGDDSPEYILTTNAYISRNDICGNELRWFVTDKDSQNLKFPLQFNLADDKGYIFGKEVVTGVISKTALSFNANWSGDVYYKKSGNVVSIWGKIVSPSVHVGHAPINIPYDINPNVIIRTPVFDITNNTLKTNICVIIVDGIIAITNPKFENWTYDLNTEYYFSVTYSV